MDIVIEEQQQQQQKTETPTKEPIKLSEISLTPMLLSLIIGFVVIVVFLIILRKRSSARRDFILTGLCESGKTCIFFQLLYKKFPDTLTSMKVNVGTYKAGRFSGRLVDIPGNYRVREKYFDLHKNTARGVIFVVDSATIQKDIRDVADALYTLLSDTALQACPFLILCNKQDQTTAKGAQIIKTILEKELNIVRDTRSRKLQTVGEDDFSKPVILGKEGRNFEFSHLTQNVQFFESTAKENQLTNLSDWIDRML